MLAIGGVIAIAAVITLNRIDPTRTRLFPPCPFHALTGLFCPGCGSTRATHHLLHGRVGTAFGYNPLVVAGLPFLALALARELRRWIAGNAQPPPLSRLPYRWVWGLLAVILAFTVARNLPWKPLRWLAP